MSSYIRCPTCENDSLDVDTLHCDECGFVNNDKSDADPLLDWWNDDIRIMLDGNAWCAHRKDFINLQESSAGFGDTPKDAVADLKINENK